jgi:pilus assembly protein CpaB
MLLATAVLGLSAYNVLQPNPQALNAQTSYTVGYFVAAHPLPAGTLTRDEDFTVKSAPSDKVPPGAIVDTPDGKQGLRGALVRKFLDAGSFVTSDDVLRPRDRGFLASVLTAGTRAISIKVDAESGVSGLIWPGDYVDVVLTHDIDKADLAHRTLSETVLQNVRIIAIDQEIVQGGSADKTAPGRETHTVSLQLAPEDVAKITVAEHLGKLSLAMRSAVEKRDTGESGTSFSGDVSPEIARQSTSVVVYSGDKAREYKIDQSGGKNE